jgi:hypothetical protein
MAFLHEAYNGGHALAGILELLLDGTLGSLFYEGISPKGDDNRLLAHTGPSFFREPCHRIVWRDAPFSFGKEGQVYAIP